MKIFVTCPCGIQFDVADWQIKSGKGKFCSKRCFYRFRSPRPKGLRYNIVSVNRGWIQVGQHLSKRTEFQKGIRNNPNGEIRSGQRISPGTEFKKGQIPSNFKGDAVGYASLHAWIRRHFGNPRQCEHCGSSQKVEWANVSLEYLRKIEDWIPLCFRCHRRFDKGVRWGSIKYKFNPTPSGRLGGTRK